MSTAEQLATALVAATRAHRRIAVDATASALALEDAMDVQARVAGALGAKAGGWKVAVIDGTPRYAPMFASNIKASGSTWSIPQEGFLVEIELALRLARDVPARPGKPYSREEIVDAVSDLVVGIELIASRFEKSPGAAPFPAWLADNMGNAAYIYGDAVPYRSVADAGALRCRYWADGVEKHDRIGGHPQNDPIMPILLNANAQTDQLGGFKAGQLVTTGSLTVPAVFDSPARLKATIDGVGSVEAVLTA
jgi:2-keto-4-pentenoate hydratase